MSVFFQISRYITSLQSTYFTLQQVCFFVLGHFKGNFFWINWFVFFFFFCNPEHTCVLSRNYFLMHLTQTSWHTGYRFKFLCKVLNVCCNFHLFVPKCKYIWIQTLIPNKRHPLGFHFSVTLQWWNNKYLCEQLFQLTKDKIFLVSTA